MPKRHEEFVLSDHRATAIRIYPGKITDIVSVCLKPMKKRKLLDEKTIYCVAWPVVTDLVGAVGDVKGPRGAI